MAVLLAVAGVCVADDASGYFGLKVRVDGSGFFLNPTITTATIENVAPDTPAAQAGVRAGDQIVEVEGHRVPGSKVKEVAPLMEKQVGQSLTLKLRRPSGEEYSARMVAVARPSE
jgi:C-terminal processing protease CtpA/Prc